eukprot:sb/3470126/
MVNALQDGPVTSYLRIEDDFYAYKSGHYDGCWAEESGVWHAVGTVGYDQYSWEVKNSWSPDWGGQGFVFIKRGRNICHFASMGVWLIGEDLYDNDNDDGDDDGDCDGACDDSAEYRENCPTWDSYCDSENYIQFMSDNCKKTCGLCKEEEEIEDPDCLDREIMCNKSFPTPLYSEWTPLTIPTNAQIEQRVLRPHFRSDQRPRISGGKCRN